MEPEVKSPEERLKDYEAVRMEQIKIGEQLTECLRNLDALQSEAIQIGARVDAAKAALLGSVDSSLGAV